MAELTENLFDNTERHRDLGCAIAYYRKRRVLTQEQLAEKVGISRQHMGAIEAPNIVRAISLDVLFNIASSLGIEPYILLKFSPEK
jgi:transcriptional regulator with XRE-family HTH domain